jgi:type IV secretion system protein TrbL
MLKHILSGGFIYLMIVNAFSWMTLVLDSFSRMGSAISGLPALSPETVLQLGGSMAKTIFDTPATASLMNNLELAIVESICGFAVLFAFAVAAIDVLLTLVEAYLVVGGGVILLGFGGNRFTAHASEGYFAHVIRVGVRLLFYSLVLAVGVQLATQWNAALLAACKPVPSALPWFETYGVPPSSIMITVCSGTISVATMLNYVVLAAVFAAVSIGVPRIAATLVGGSIGHALTHAFEAAYIARTVVRPITSAIHGLGKIAQSSVAGAGGGQAQRMALSEKLSQGDTSAPTRTFDPFSGKPDPSAGTPAGPNDGTRVIDGKLTRPIGSSRGAPGGHRSTVVISPNGNGKGTVNIGAGSKGTTKI